jgi:hypothetical protein
MVALGLVRRKRFKEMPPRVELELTGAGYELVPIAKELARWGMQHLWSPPQERELVDLDALLRQLPALLEAETGLPDGSLEALVTDSDPPLRCVYRVEDGRLRMDESARSARQAPATSTHAASNVAPAVASIVGAQKTWIAALGGPGDQKALCIGGDVTLAQRIFDALPGSSTGVCHNGGRAR